MRHMLLNAFFISSRSSSVSLPSINGHSGSTDSSQSPSSSKRPSSDGKRKTSTTKQRQQEVECVCSYYLEIKNLGNTVNSRS